MRRRLLVFPLLVLLLCVACNSKPVRPIVSPLDSPASPQIASSATATLASSLTPTPLPTATPTPAGIAPPPGVIYKTGKELWRVNSDGNAVRLLDRSFDDLSSDGTSAIDMKGSSFIKEISLIDLMPGQQRSLTETLGHSFCCAVWWPERSNAILFGSWPLETLGRDSDYLSVIRADGGGFKILDDKNTFTGEPAPAPDGATVVYTGDPTGMIYEWGKAPRPFEPMSFGLSVDYLKSPSWSPDGRKMTWTVVTNDQYSLGSFDLTKHSAELLHPYPATVEWPPAPIWSPDGQWLALIVNNDASMKQELWVVLVSAPQEEHFLRNDFYLVNPVWSPDGHWLASGHTLYEVGTWRAQPLALPPDAEVVAWIDPAPQSPIHHAVRITHHVAV